MSVDIDHKMIFLEKREAVILEGTEILASEDISVWTASDGYLQVMSQLGRSCTVISLSPSGQAAIAGHYSTIKPPTTSLPLSPAREEKRT